MAEKRYEREIDELLRRLDDGRQEPLPFRPRRQPSRLRLWLGQLSQAFVLGSLVEWLLAAAVALLLASFVLRLVGMPLSAALAVLAVVCFVSSLTIAVWHGTRRPAGRHYGRYGPPPGQSSVDWDGLTQRLRQWWRRFRR